MATLVSGAWIWQLSKLPTNYLQLLQKANCRRVYLKVFDDASSEWFWGFQCTKEIVKRFNDAGIEVWGWGYHFDKRTHPDVVRTMTCVLDAMKCGLAGYVVDVEEEIKNPQTHRQLENILVELKKVVPAGCLAYTSFGHPEFHPEIPWKILDEYCDIAMPQIYFEKFTFGPGASGTENENAIEVEACIQAHKKLGLKKPILPIWGSESDSQFPASAKELQKYLDKFPGSSLWRLPNAGERGHGFALNYNGDDVAPGEPTPDMPKVEPKFLEYAPCPVPVSHWRAVLQLGSQGPDVWQLNCALIGLGIMPMDSSRKVSDAFDSLTDKYVRFLQKRSGLVVDGAVGEHTRAAIESALARARAPKNPNPEDTVRTQLHTYYSSRSGYDAVYKAVVHGWFGSTKNACVAFLSEALRQSGYHVPKATWKDGFNISMWTSSLWGWMAANKWEPIHNWRALLPGDCVFTTDGGAGDGHPSHVYMFDAWVDKDAGLANVVDNQGFTHVRNIHKAGGGFNFTPYWFHMRLPE